MTDLLKVLFAIIACHFIGDYVLQGEFLSTTKGRNWYHLLIHALLYTVPFALWFGIDWRIAVLFLMHLPMDALKARWHRLSYFWDQFIHIYFAVIFYLVF
ncbi:MAG: DUF3307 domain-containing protein [Spirochaetales bacterium]|nr:DUF3307 domain-containing protein [Candidatus Physcosoma equi]